MGILVMAAITAAAVWLTVAGVRGWISIRWMSYPCILALTVIIAGSVFGREFFSIDIGPLPLSLDRLLWIGMMIQFGWLLVMGRNRLAPIQRIDLLVGALALVLAFSTFSHDFTYRDNLPLARLLFFNFMPMGIYLVARTATVDERQLRWIWYSLIGFAIYLAATGIAEWRNWPQFVFPRFIMDIRYSEFLGRARGPFLNPVACGIFQSVGLVAAIAAWPGLGRRGRIVAAGIISLLLLGIFATFTRSVWIAAALAATITLWLPASNRQRGGLIIVGASALALFVAFFAEDIKAFKRDKEVSKAEMAESAQLRPLLAEVAMQMAVDRPVLGHGFGQYVPASRIYHQQVSTSPLKKVLPYRQHNVLLSYLTETGLVGMSLLIGIGALFLMASYQVYARGRAGSAARAIGLLGMVTLLLYFVNGMFHDVSIVPMVGSLFYFMLGLNSQLVASEISMESPARPGTENLRHPAWQQRKAS